MAQITNLSRVRKQKARDEARRKGGENAARFGRTLDQRRADDAQAERAARHLDAHCREDGDD